MAVVNFYSNPLKSKCDSFIIKKTNKTIRESIKEYLDTKKIESETYEVYNIRTGETTYETALPDGYKVLTIVNGEEKSLEYKLKNKDIVTVIFIPMSNANTGDWLTIFGSTVMILAGIVVGVASLGSGWEIGVPMIIGGVIGLTAGIITAATRKPLDAVSSDKSQLSSEQALTIKGAENQLITDQRFPFIFGKTSINPYIMGSPYHETYVDADGRFHSQYFNALYCVGYGPLKLTDIKIGNTVLSYNRKRPEAVGEENNITVMHGNICAFEHATVYDPTITSGGDGYYIYNSYRRSYEKPDRQPINETEFNAGTFYVFSSQIPKKWKNNDVQFEILQNGLLGVGNIENEIGDTQNIKQMYGELYNRTITEDTIDANLLYIHDSDIGEAASKSYKGVDIPQGFRTNTVRLSNNNPYHLEVELDFPSGIYRSRSKSEDNKSSVVYQDIPVRYAIQWRCVYNGQKESDAENKNIAEMRAFEIGTGTEQNPQRPYAMWRSFEKMKNGYEQSAWSDPHEYTLNDSIIDASLNFGANINNDWIKSAMTNYARDYIKPIEQEMAIPQATADATYERTNIYGGPYYNPNEQQALIIQNAEEIAEQKYTDWVDTKDYNKIIQVMNATVPGTSEKYIQSPNYNVNWIGTPVFNVNDGKDYNAEYSPNYFNGNERIHLFTKDFSADEVKAIINSDANYVEVRVIRLTPCYIDQSGTNDEKYGDYSYQDLGKWSYLRTSVFDRDKYEKTNMTENPANYPLRPIRSEDLTKFCFVSIRLKQDVAETGGSSLKKLRMIAESFSPTFNETTNKWQPEELHEKIRYCQKYYDEITEKWVIDTTLTKEEYDQKIADHEEGLYTKRDGNDYVDQIASEIFTNSAKVATQPFAKYKLLDDVGTKYNDNNSASSTMLAFVGPQLGEYAKTYDSINLESAAEMFKFCKDVTDGTEDKSNPGQLLHMKYSCNGVISGDTKLESVVKDFLITGRCVIKRDEHNKYDFFIGKKVKYVMDLLNNKSVISKSNTRTFADIPAGFQTTFQDEEDDYTVDPLYIMDYGEDWRNPSKSTEQIAIQYVTNRNQMYSLCRYNLAARLYQRETYTRTVGKRGFAYSLGDVVLLQDDSLLVGTDNGARIVELIQDEQKKFIYGFFTDEPYEYKGEVVDGLCTQGITLVQSSKYGASRCVTLRLATPDGNELITSDKIQKGLTNLVPLANPITIDEDFCYSSESLQGGEYCAIEPKIGDLLAFGTIGQITQKAQIISIKPSKGNFTLTLVPYDDSFYNFGSEIPVFNPKLTVPEREKEITEFSSYATKADISDSKTSTQSLQKDPSKDLNTTTTITRCEATETGIIMVCETKSSTNTKITPISVVWRIYRQTPTTAYSEVTITQEEFDERKGSTTNPLYYYEDYQYKFTNSSSVFDPSVQYYNATSSVVDNLISEFTTPEESYSFTFNRAQSVENLGGYPEYYDFYNLKVTAYAKLTTTSRSPESAYTRINVDNYGTWKVKKPVIKASITDRTATLNFFQPSSTGRRLYGSENIIYHVQIKKAGPTNPDTEWYKPNTKDNPYPEYDSEGVLINTNEDKYKAILDESTNPVTYDTGEELCGVSFTQTLPLEGQASSNGSVNTSYKFKVYAMSQAGWTSDPEEVTITALVTNIRDIVKANLTSKEEYVENLSAISAHLGDISDGSLSGSENNYWTLSNKENAPSNPGEHNKNYKGAFRVGGENQFLLVEPVVEGNNPEPVAYNITMKIGNFEVNSQTSKLTNNMYLYSDNDYSIHDQPEYYQANPQPSTQADLLAKEYYKKVNDSYVRIYDYDPDITYYLQTEKYHTKRMYISYEGMILQSNTGTTDEGPWQVEGQVTMDNGNNLIITNTDENDPNYPKVRVYIADGIVYHINTDTNDEDGGNAGNITFTGSIVEDARTPFASDGERNVFGGTLQRTVNDTNDFVAFVRNATVDAGDKVITNSPNSIDNFNSLDKSSWGLSSSQSSIFNYKDL